MPRLTAACRPVLALAVLLATAAAPLSAQQAPTPMTADDLLNVRIVSEGEFSPDGRWMVTRMARRGDGLGFVAARD